MCDYSLHAVASRPAKVRREAKAPEPPKREGPKQRRRRSRFGPLGFGIVVHARENGKGRPGMTPDGLSCAQIEIDP